VCLSNDGNLVSVFLSTNEIAVEVFFAESITYLDRYRVISETLSSYPGEQQETPDE